VQTINLIACIQIDSLHSETAKRPANPAGLFRAIEWFAGRDRAQTTAAERLFFQARPLFMTLENFI
jgi:hypothetical protein